VTCLLAGILISLAKLGFSSITCSCSVLAEAKAMEEKLAEVLWNQDVDRRFSICFKQLQ
jgi:hypothetical protein